MHGYGKPWKRLNNFYIDCMRRIVGAGASVSSVALLVRMGVMPLQYEFAYRAVLWYLKIFRGESDKLLTEQLHSLLASSEIEHTCFYRHCKRYIEQLSRLGGGQFA